MSIFKKIKSAFIIEEGNTSDTAKTTESKSAPRETPVDNLSDSQVVDQPDSSYETTEGKINQKFTNILLKAIEAQNQTGFDYIEFKQSIQNLLKMNMDEPTMYRSAYATAQTLGATPDNLVASAQRYLAVLKKEEEKFNAALISQRSKQIDGGLDEVKNVEQSIQDKRRQIEQLKKEVAASEAKLGQMKNEIQDANRKIKATQQDFIASYGNLVSQIAKDVENINSYLK